MNAQLTRQIGGSYDDTGIADITLTWMMSQLMPLLSFDQHFIGRQHELNIKYHEDQRVPPREWAMGKIYNSHKGIEVLAGEKVRTPGQYTVTNLKTGKSTSQQLYDTQEFIHASVRIRRLLGGRGTEDKGSYHPSSLLGYRCEGDPQQGTVRWVYEGKRAGEPGRKGNWQKALPEDVLGPMELELLAKSPKAFALATKGEQKV